MFNRRRASTQRDRYGLDSNLSKVAEVGYCMSSEPIGCQRA